MRIAVFTDYDATAGLVAATIAEARRRDGEVAVVVTNRPGLLTGPSTRLRLTRAANALIRGRRPRRRPRVATVCAEEQVPFLVTPEQGPNDPVFIARLKRDHGADVALSYWSTRIFDARWLAAFDAAVNLHDGTLPGYRGMGATNMEIYAGESHGGFTFHHIDEGIDTGNVLVAGTVSLDDKTPMQVVEDKLAAAAGRIGEVLEAIASGDPGRPAAGPQGYTSARDMADLVTVADPSALPGAEIVRRLRAFGSLNIAVARHGVLPVTAVVTTGGSPTIAAADGPLTVTAIDGLPPRIYLAARAVRNRMVRS